MINYFHPIDNYYDDGYYLSPRAQRELRRRRELEFYRQQQEQEEARRVAYEQELRREHLRELQRRRELEEEEQRQRAYYRTQQEKQRRRREEAASRKAHLSTVEQEDEPPMYRVVQGPDGRLYRIPAVQEEPNVPRGPKYTVVRGPGGRLYRVRTSDSSSDAQLDEEPEQITTRSRRDRIAEKETSPEQLDIMETLHNEENVSPKDATKKAQHLGKSGTARTGRSQQRKNKKRVTVIVEDASDSEMEDDELNSVWRHRRPSPGEWMEPVDN